MVETEYSSDRILIAVVQYTKKEQIRRMFELKPIQQMGELK